MSELSGTGAGAGSGKDGGAGAGGGARDRTFLVTGGNTGIGRATATALAAGGGRVYITSRSAEAGAAAVDAIKSAAGSQAVWLLPLDLASLASVRDCAAAFLAKDEPLHVLVNNAGVGGQRGKTAEGFELHFGVNHLGHFALTMLLLDRLKASGSGDGQAARVVTVSSDAHYGAHGIDFDAVRRSTPSFTGQREYAVSKLCNVLFTQELARRVSDVSSYALHPGVVASDIWRRVPRPARASSSAGCSPSSRARSRRCTAPRRPRWRPRAACFYDKCAVRAPSRVATPELAGLLWKHSTEWTGLG